MKINYNNKLNYELNEFKSYPPRYLNNSARSCSNFVSLGTNSLSYFFRAPIPISRASNYGNYEF